MDEQKSRYEELTPYSYQTDIYAKIKENWRNERRFGNIVFLETGTGKTYIAIMLLKAIFGEDLEARGLSDAEMCAQAKATEEGATLKPLSSKEIENKYSERLQKIERLQTLQEKEVFNKNRKIVVFLIPTQNLVEQQGNIIDRYTEFTVGRYHGGQKNKRFYTDYEAWQSEMAVRDVLVMMAKKFYDLLVHGFIQMSQISLLVVDECHHTDQEHLYNMIMRDFFFHRFNPLDANCKRPRVLGLTASPIKQKIESKCVLPDDIEKMLQNLANNLYSRYVTMSQEQIRTMEQQLDTEIKQYRSNFDENVETVQQIEEILIKKLLATLSLPGEFYKTELNRYKQPIKQVFQLLNDEVSRFTREEQDTQVLNFLNGRKQLIELDCSYSKKEIDITMFPKYEDQMLLLFCIIILKNVNNLLIEIGPLAVKTFVLDLKHDLWEINTDKLRFGDKKQILLEAIEEFCHFQKDKSEEREQLSDKVIQLIDILQKSYEQFEQQNGGSQPKTIIFVKDRSVAVYLKKILNGSSEIKPGDKKYFEGKDLLDTKKFRIGFAMGPKSKSLINKAYKSTKVQTGHELKFKAITQQFPSCRTIKLTKTQLDQTLNDFRSGYINILIATNVVEEGLDVSTCNQVICLNELLTVKAFIQMKGRARQVKSKFIFLCAKEQYTQVKEDQESFKRVISFMKTITSRSKKELLPYPDIIETKQNELPEIDYIEVKETGAKLVVRDAKIFIDQFCLMCAPATMNMSQNLNVNDLEKQMVDMTQDKSTDVSMADAEQKYLAFRPNYVIRESMHQNSQKYFLCVLYMPKTCHAKGITKVNPKNAYAKKRDAENHVALLAIKKLYDKGFLTNYLFVNSKHEALKGCIGAQNGTENSPVQIRQSMISDTMSMSSSFTNNPQSYVPRKQKQTTEEQRMKKHQDDKMFQNAHKGRLDFEQLPNQVNKREFTCRVEDIKVYTFFADKDDAYPYKTTSDFIGILYDSELENPCFDFMMYQENKQRDKNSVHLANLLKLNLISNQAYNQALQTKDALKVSLLRRQVFRLGDDVGKASAEESLAKISLFHYWLFYYMYSADHKFLSSVMSNDFPFVSHLFRQDVKDIEQYRKDKRFFKEARKRMNVDKQSLPQIPRKCYTVPIIKTTKNGEMKLGINWELIDRVLEHTRHRLYETKILTSERNIVIQKYDLEEWIRKQHFPIKQESAPQCSECPQPCKHDFELVHRQQRARMTKYLWDQNFQGNRYVILYEESNHDFEGSDVLKTPLDYNQNKQDRAQFKQQMDQWKQRCARRSLNASSSEFYPNNFYNQLSLFSQSIQQMNESEATSKLMQKRATKQEYYFLKQGIFMSSMFNKYVVKCRKERHFFDFGKKNKEDEEQTYSQYQKTRGKQRNNQSTRQRLEQSSVLLNAKKVNTEFDIIDSMLTRSPLSYNQYQVLLQTCFHLQNFNEFLVIEKFINHTFDKDKNGNYLYCLLQGDEPAKIATDLFRTIEQMAETECKPNEDVQMKDLSGKQSLSGGLRLADNSEVDLDLQKQPEEAVRVCRASEQLQKKMNLMREALTSPSACRDYDYERLEFYGDSIAGFLVILELFLTRPTYVEGDLDHERINKVQNTRFFKVNREENFYLYMITDPHHVYSGFVPSGFDNKLKFQEEVIHKSVNEQQNRLCELEAMDKRLDLILTKNQSEKKSYFEDPLKYMFLRGDIYSLLSMLVRDFEEQGDNSLVFEITDGHIYKQFWDSQRQCLSHHDKVIMLQKHILDYDNLSGPFLWMKRNIKSAIKRFRKQLEDKRLDRDSKNGKTAFLQKTMKRQLYLKQLADVVESITGAVALACGLNFVQVFLHNIGILSETQDSLKQHMERLTQQKQQMNKILEPKFFESKNLKEVERILQYEFKCKAWLIEALTHKSWIDQSVENSLNLGQDLRIQDYERLEFLGDSILSYLVAKYFFLTTQKDKERKMPKELHKMKTSIIQNCCLSLIVIEKGIHNHVIYNEKALAFKLQFDECVKIVQDLNQECGTTEQLCEQMKRMKLQESSMDQSMEESKSESYISASKQSSLHDRSVQRIGNQEFSAIDLDRLHEHNLKIFGDVFESLMGAVFMDSQSIDRTWEVLEKLIMPYIQVYANLETLQDHPRTKLLELWNQKSYTKMFKCNHSSDIREETILFKGEIRIQKRQWIILEEEFQKEAKNKIRSFYKKFYELISRFVKEVEKSGDEHSLDQNPQRVVDKIKEVHAKMQKEEQSSDVSMDEKK